MDFYIWLIIGISAFVFITLIFLLTTLIWCFKKAFYKSKKPENIYKIPKEYNSSREKMISLIDEMAAIPFEEVTVTSFDGLKLYGRYYKVDDNAPLQIQFHGYRGTAIRDFCGGNKLARESGFNTLVVDQRAHGKSEGKVITFGIKERYDCLTWAEYAAQRFNCDIYLAGVSMGAATVLMASELELPKNVKGIIADCPYSSPSAILRKVCKYDMGLPERLSFLFLKVAAKLFGKFDVNESSAVSAVRNSEAPVLLIHGEADKFVPCDMSREIKENAKDARLYTFPGAGHGISYILDPLRYAEITRKFIDEIKNKEK